MGKCNCTQSRECTWCYLGAEVAVRRQAALDILSRVHNAPLIDNDTDFESIIDNATKEYNESPKVSERKVIKVCFKSKQRLS